MSDSKKDISNSYLSVFDENVSTESDEVFINRDYQKLLLGEEVQGAMNVASYTRSQYVKDYNDIVENYKKEQKEKLLCIAATVMGAIVLSILADVLQKLADTSGMSATFVILGAVVVILKVVIPTVSIPIIIGFLRSMKKSKKLKNFHLEQLEKRKQIQMENGTYDAGR